MHDHAARIFALGVAAMITVIDQLGELSTTRAFIDIILAVSGSLADLPKQPRRSRIFCGDSRKFGAFGASIQSAGGLTVRGVRVHLNPQSQK